MKSAYELAMERLEKSSGPTRKLSDEQKGRIAEIDKKYAARAAELKLSLEQKMSAAASAEEQAQLQEQLTEEMRTLEGQRDREKDAVWEEG